jgi:T1SS-143 domain-containing protein
MDWSFDTSAMPTDLTAAGDPVSFSSANGDLNLMGEDLVSIDYGADGPADGAPTALQFGDMDWSFDTSSLPTDLTAAGDAVTFSQSNGVLTATADAGGANERPVFTVSINADGTYTFDLQDQIDHPVFTEEDVLTFDFAIQGTPKDGVGGTDFDLDPAALDGLVFDHGFKVQVVDDVPTAVDDSAGPVEEGQAVSGNLIDPNDTEGADEATVTEIAYTNADGDPATMAVDPTNGATVTTQTGTLTVAADGTYTFTADANAVDGSQTVDEVFTYTLTDGDGDQDTAQLTVNITDDDEPTVTISYPGAQGGPGLVDEDDLGTEGGDLDTGSDQGEASSVSGTIAVDTFDDGFGGIELSIPQALEDLNLTSGGEAIGYTLSTDGQTITGAAGGDSVFTMSLTGNETDGFGWTFDLTGQIDHADGAGENLTATLPFGVTVTDSDGDSADALIQVAVQDDVPVAVDDGTRTLEEGGQTVTGDVMANDTEGADGAEVTGFTYTDENGNQAIGTIGVEADTEFGKLTVNADGTYSYTSDANETHTDGNPLTESFTYTLTDADGDTSSAVQAFTITDDGPSIDPPTPDGPPPTDPPPPGEPPVGEGDPNNPEIGVNAGRVDEDDLATGSDDTKEPTTVTGTLTVDGGADGVGSIELVDNGDFPSLTSNGTSLSYDISPDGQTVTGSAGGDPVFTMTLTGGGTGYSFELLGVIDHPDGADQNEVDLPFTVQVTDGDGSTASSTFHISVVDDVPTAVDDGVFTTEEGGAAVSANLLDNDTIGADVDGTVTSITYTDANGDSQTRAIDADGETVTTQFGTLTVGPDGAFTFTPNAGIDHDGAEAVTESFQYTLTDNDGDTSTATATLEITDDGEPTITFPEPPGGPGDPGDPRPPADGEPLQGSGAAVVDEADLDTDGADLTDGTDQNLVDDSFTGQPIFVDFGQDGPAATDPLVFADPNEAGDPTGLIAKGLTSGGEAVSYTVSADGTQITGAAGGETVFTVTLSGDGQGNFGYSFDLVGELDHAPGGDANMIEDIPFTVIATDADGSTAEGTIQVDVIDDVPVARTDAIILGQAESRTVDEDDLADGTDGSQGTSVSGDLGFGSGDVIAIDYGADGPADGAPSGVTFTDMDFTIAGPAGLTSQGDAITYSQTGNVLTATADAGGANERPVFTVEINADGSYTFDLQDSLDHAAGQGENALDLGFTLTATPNASVIAAAIDGDGDPAQGLEGASVAQSFTVSVTDDVPEPVGVGGGYGANLLINSDFEDGGTGHHTDLDIPGWTTGSTGGEVHDAGRYNLEDDGYDQVTESENREFVTLSQQVPGVPAGTTLQLQFDMALRNADQATSDDGFEVIWNGETVATITDLGDWQTFTYEVEAGAGDGTDTLTFQGIGTENSYGAVLDNVSLRAELEGGLSNAGQPADTLTLDEDDLTDGTDATKESLTASGDLGLAGGQTLVEIDYGADGPADGQGGGLTYGDFDYEITGPDGLTSQGEAVTYSYDAASQTLTAEADGREVFTVTLDGNGGFSFTLKDSLDHADADGENALDLGFTLTGTPKADSLEGLDFDQDDLNGDGAFNITHPFTVSVIDDVPTAVSAVEGGGEPVQVTITKDNFDAPDAGYTVTGRTIQSDGTLSEKSTDHIGTHNNPPGFGVEGGASGADVETGFSANLNLSEELHVDFDNPVTTVDVAYSWQNSQEDSTITLYRDGEVVGQHTVTGVTDRVDDPHTFTADDGGEFDSIVISAPGVGDDFLVHSIEFQMPAEGGIPSAETLTLDEDDLIDGTDDDKEGLTATGSTGLGGGLTLAEVDYGADGPADGQDGALTYADFDFTIGGPAGLTSQGEPVEYDNSTPGELVATAGGREVFTVTLDANGDYTFTLKDSLDHADAQGENTLPIELTLTGTPKDGLEALKDFDLDPAQTDGGLTISQSLTINVVDDVPMAVANEIDGGNQAEVLQVTNMGQESAAYENTYGFYVKGENGEPTTGEIIFANTKEDIGTTVTIEGVDPADVGFFVIPNGYTANGESLTNGTELTFEQDESGEWHAVADGARIAGTGDPVLFSDPALNEQSFDYTTDNQLAGNQNWEDLAGGGDLDFNDVNIDVQTITIDAIPTVDEDDLADGTSPDAGALSVDGSLGLAGEELISIDYGADGAADGAPAGLGYGDLSFTIEGPAGLTSQGEAVEYDNSTPGELVATADGREVFTVSLNADGSFTFTLKDTIDHAQGSGQNTTALNFGLLGVPAAAAATDFDLDPASLADVTFSHSFQVNVVDDVPEAVDDGTVALDEGGASVSGNVMANDTEGADGATVTEIAYTAEGGAAATAIVDPVDGVTVDTEHGSLTVHADGSYTFTSDTSVDNPNGQAATETFSYTITDADGDTATAQHSFSIEDTLPDLALQIGPAEGYEDQPIALSISADLAEANNAVTVGVELNNVPTDATLVTGTGQTLTGADSYTLTPADLEGLTIQAGTHSADDFGITVTATATHTVTGESVTTDPMPLPVTVMEIADGPTLDVTANVTATGDDGTDDYLVGGAGSDTLLGGAGDDTIEGQGGNDLLIGDEYDGVMSAALDIDVGLIDQDGSEVAGLTLSGLPDGATLSADTGPIAVSGGSAELTAADLAGLTVSFPSGTEGFDITVAARTVDTDFDDSTTDTSADVVQTISVGLPGGDGFGDDTITGGAGDDTIYGNRGDDILHGDGPDACPEGYELVTGTQEVFVTDRGPSITIGGSHGSGDQGEPGDGVSVSEGGYTMTGMLGGLAAGAIVSSITYTAEGGQVLTALVDPTDGASVDTQYGQLTVQADGSFTYTSDADEDHGASGEPLTDPFSFTAAVPTEFGEGSITADNYADTGAGFTVTARSLDENGQLTDASVDNVSTGNSNGGPAIGVVGNTGGPAGQLGYDQGEAASEQLIVDFDQDVTGVTFSVANHFETESGGEVGTWTAYKDGEMVAQSDFMAPEGANIATIQVDLPDGVTIDQLVFTAQPYAGDTSSTSDSSDYWITDITYTYGSLPDVGDVSFNDTLYGEEGNDQLYGDKGDDILRGGADSDTVDGGTGIDDVHAGSDDDVGIFTVGQGGVGERYDGGTGTDTLTIRYTADDLTNPQIVEELREIQQFIADNSDPNTDSGAERTFEALGLTVQDWEDVILDGPDLPNPVVAEDDTDSAVEGGETVTGNLLSNDATGGGTVTEFTYTKEDGSQGTASAGDTVDTLYGELTVQADGSYTYTTDPSEDHSGGGLTETVGYTVENEFGSDTATLSIDVGDTVPQAMDDANATVEGGAAISGNLLANDDLGADGSTLTSFSYTDADGNPATGQPGETVTTQTGTLTVQASGAYTFVANGSVTHTSDGVLETESFSYTITDGDGDTSSATAIIDISDTVPEVDAIASDAAGNEDQWIQLNMDSALLTSEGPDAVSITISGVPEGAQLNPGTEVEPGVWTATAEELPSVCILPPQDFSGEINLTLTVTTTDVDGDTDTDTEAFTVFVSPVVDQIDLTTQDAAAVACDPDDDGGTTAYDLPDMGKDISNIVLYLSDSEGTITKVKIEGFPDGSDGVQDADHLPIQQFVDQNYPDSNLVGALTVKAGNNATDGYGPGEGELFIVDTSLTEDGLPTADHADAEWQFNQAFDGMPIGPENAGTLTTGTDVSVADGGTLTINADQIGTAGNDVLTGTPEVDTIVGAGGDDIISGLDSNDVLIGDTPATAPKEGCFVAPVAITVGDNDIDGSEVLTVEISNVPTGATLTNTAGDVFTGSSVHVLTPDQLDGLQIEVPNGTGDFTLAVDVTSLDTDPDRGTTDTGTVTGSVSIDIPDTSNDFGVPGDDTITGGSGDDTIYGQQGNDVLYGDGGQPDLTGGETSGNTGGTSGPDVEAIFHFGLADTDWSSNETVTDSVTGMTGVAKGGTGESSDGESAQFDGHCDYIEVPHAAAMETQTGTFTIDFVAWNNGTLASKDSKNYDDGGHFNLEVNSDREVELRVQTDSESFYLKGGDVDWSNWHNATVTWDGETVSLYVNGEVVDSVESSWNMAANQNPWTFAADQGRSGDNVADNLRDYLNGQIDNPTLLGGPLSADEVSSMVSGGVESFVSGLGTGGSGDGGDATGGTAFTLGMDGLSPTEYDIDQLWNQQVDGYQITVTPYSDWASQTVGAFDYETKNGDVRGLGVEGGPDQEVDKHEAIKVDFGGMNLTDVTVGLRSLFQEGQPADDVETATWIAYKDGAEVATGTIDAVSGTYDGKVTADISVDGGFDTLVFTSVEQGSDFHLETISAVTPAVTVPDGSFNDTIHGGSGDDRIHGQIGDDFLQGGSGDDIVAGGSGSDWIMGGTDNGTATFTQGSIEVTFQGTSAAYSNSVGYYVLDEEGTPETGEVIWSNLHETAVGSSHTILLDGFDPEDVGFFLIPDGADRNEGLTDGTVVTFTENADGTVTVYADGEPLSGKDADAYFSNPASLNPDGQNHVQSTEMTDAVGVTINADGKDGYFEGGDVISGQKVTVEVGFKSDSIGDDFTPLVSYSAGRHNGNEFTIGANNGVLTVIVAGVAVATNILASGLFDGEEHMVSATWDGENGDLKVYVDGVEGFSASGIAAGESLQGGGTLVFGQEQDQNGGGFDDDQVFSGSYTQARFFDDLRDPVEIAQNAGEPLENEDDANLVADYRFGSYDAGSKTVADASGNGNDLEYKTVDGFDEASDPEILVGGAGETLLGFEDLVGNGDEDFNDAILSVRPVPTEAEFQGGDQLWGGEQGGDGDGATDAFFYARGDGVDTIHDFEVGTDQLFISGYDRGEMNIMKDGDDTIISLGDGGAIKLVGVDAEMFGSEENIAAYDADTDGSGALSIDELMDMKDDVLADGGEGGGSVPQPQDAGIVMVAPVEPGLTDGGGNEDPQNG